MEKRNPEETLWARWLSGDLSETERSQLEREDLSGLENILGKVKDLDLPDRPVDKAWQKQMARQQAEPKPKVKQLNRRRWWWYAAAAVALLLIGILVYPRNQAVSFVAGTGEQLQVPLPDGSEAIVNAESSLDFDRRWKSTREVNLEGEAFFSVKEGSTFRVHTPLGQIEVLGTTFNVRARGQSLEVSCHSGRVRVTADEEMAELSPGELLIKHLGSPIDRLKFVGPETPGWTTGDIELTQASIERVTEELEIQYGLTVQFPDDLPVKSKIIFPVKDLAVTQSILEEAYSVETVLSPNRDSLVIRRLNSSKN